MEQFQKSREKAESELWLFTKGTQAPVSWQVAAKVLVCCSSMKILLSSMLVFLLLVFLEFFCEFLTLVHLLGLGSLLSKIS